MQKCNQLFRQAQQTGSTRLRNLYKLKRNKVTQLLRCSKREYFKKMKPNSKQFWKVARLLKGCNKTILMLIVNDQEVTSDSEKVEVLCNHFTKSFNNSPDDVQSIEVDLSACPERLLCTEEEIFSLLTSPDVTKASGPDGISACMLKATAATIAPVVTKLFNLSISTGPFPWTAKSSLVVPVPKSTDHTYICSLVTDELHLSSHSVFHQWGFRSGHSTSSALTTVINDQLKSMEHSLLCLLRCSKSI